MSDCGDIHNCSACWAKHEAEQYEREQEMLSAAIVRQNRIVAQNLYERDQGTFFMGGRL